jgi:hypothetical protein
VLAVVVTLSAVSLLIASVTLFVAGAHRNSQVTALKTHGIRVIETVSGCTGLLGGSGSNAAGYSCRGSVSIGGKRYFEPVPGSDLYVPGSKIPVVVDASDPGLVSSVSAVASEHATPTVFVLPAILFALFLGLMATVGLRSRRRVSGRRVVGEKSVGEKSVGAKS